MTVDRVVNDLYASIGWDASRRPDWQRLAEIFADNARLVRVNDDGIFEFSPATFRENLESMICAGGIRSFHEREVWRETREFGDVAFVVSGYEMRTSAEGELIARAVKSIQLYRQNDRWRISAMLWRREGRGARIPEAGPEER